MRRRPKAATVRPTTPIGREARHNRANVDRETAGRRASASGEQIYTRATNVAIYGGADVPAASKRPDVRS